jgi:hypothetical protein
MSIVLRTSLALALAAPCLAQAVEPAQAGADNPIPAAVPTATLRAEFDARLQALEERLRAAEARAGSAAAATTTAHEAGAPAASANAFNPAISLILSGGYTRTSQDPARYALTGFQLPVGGDAGPGERGFSLGESELGLAASIDPWTRGAANISFHPDNTVSVEEAYVQTTSLGQGLSLKGGRFLSGVGYLNEQHAHTWDFVDNPLAYQALLGTQYGDDGVQLRWLAPTDRFIELGLELGRGRSFPGGDNPRNGAGMFALSAHTGDDIGDSHSWRAGLSVLGAKADDQQLNGIGLTGDAILNSFSGRTRVWVADGVWKWAPGGNATRTSFKLQGEWLRSERRGDLTADLAGAGGGSTAAYRAQQTGWYVQGVWQFMPGWHLGLRTERLDAAAPDVGANAAVLAGSDGYSPRKHSLMVDVNASEFSRVRVQLAQDRSREGLVDRQLFLQYQMSLGAHGAHSY